MNAPHIPKLPYRREIDGLRAIAVLPVILYHAGFRRFGGGFVGVDVFFVISGYLISSILLPEIESGSFSLLTFYERRARRILPALLFVMLACLPFAWAWMWPHELRGFCQSLAAAGCFASNILFWRTSGYFDVAGELKPLLHTWSLGVEEQYYLLFPLVLRLLCRLGRRGLGLSLIVLGLLSFSAAAWYSKSKPAAVFYLLPARGWELGTGVLVALWASRTGGSVRSPIADQVGSFAGLSAILVAVFAFDQTTPFPAPTALVPALGSAAVLVFATPRTLIGRMLGWGPLVGIGLVSYSAYLWHQPLFAFARLFSVLSPSPFLMGSLALGSLGLATLTWRFVERPFRNREAVSRRAIFVSTSLVSASVVALGLLGAVLEGFPSRIPPDVAKVLSYSTSHLPDLRYRRADGTDCFRTPGIIGDLGATPEALLTGDSHAGMLVPALDAELRAAGKSAYVFADGDIYVHDYPSWYPQRERHLQALERTRRALSLPATRTVILLGRYALKITREPFDNREGGVELLEAYRGNPEHRQAELVGSIAQGVADLLDSGKRVLFVEPIPETGWLVPERLADLLFKHGLLRPLDGSTSARVYDERNRRVLGIFEGFRSNPAFASIPSKAFFCGEESPERCVTHQGGVPLYSDDSHLTLEGSSRIARAIVRRLQAPAGEAPPAPPK